MEGILIGGLVGVILVCAIEVVRGYFFDKKMRRQEELFKQRLLFEVQWNLEYAGLKEQEIKDILTWISYRWDDELI